MPDSVLVDRLAYAVLKVADEVEDMRGELRNVTAALGAIETRIGPCVAEYDLLLKARSAETVAGVNLRAGALRALAQPAVIAAIISALLAGLGIASTGERIVADARALSGDTTTIEVHNAPAP